MEVDGVQRSEIPQSLLLRVLNLASSLLSAISPQLFTDRSVRTTIGNQSPLVETLYLDGETQQGMLPPYQMSDTIPKIVRRVFSFASKALRERPRETEILHKALELTMTLMSIDDAAYFVLDGKSWLSALLDALAKVRVVSCSAKDRSLRSLLSTLSWSLRSKAVDVQCSTLPWMSQARNPCRPSLKR